MKKDDFKQYVEMALRDTDLATMRPVVEKELLHFEIFNALDEAGLLKNLVFQGGTSLRLCRGSDRFSEDLDFAGGKGFSSASVEKIKDCIVIRIGDRFGLKVTVKDAVLIITGSVRTATQKSAITKYAQNRLANIGSRLEVINRLVVSGK